MQNQIQQAVKVLREGGIIAYPTEGVFGLGCDPFNETAVLRLLKIKRRKRGKGLILIAASWKQTEPLIKEGFLSRDIIKQSKSQPITWVFPAAKKVPKWISGGLSSIAIRVTQHSRAKEICKRFGGPIVSTSANLAGQLPANTAKQVQKQFGEVIDFMVSGRVGGLKKTTEIRDVKTNKMIRK